MITTPELWRPPGVRPYRIRPRRRRINPACPVHGRWRVRPELMIGPKAQVGGNPLANLQTRLPAAECCCDDQDLSCRCAGGQCPDISDLDHLCLDEDGFENCVPVDFSVLFVDVTAAPDCVVNASANQSFEVHTFSLNSAGPYCLHQFFDCLWDSDSELTPGDPGAIPQVVRAEFFDDQTCTIMHTPPPGQDNDNSCNINIIMSVPDNEILLYVESSLTAGWFCGTIPITTAQPCSGRPFTIFNSISAPIGEADMSGSCNIFNGSPLMSSGGYAIVTACC